MDKWEKAFRAAYADACWQIGRTKAVIENQRADPEMIRNARKKKKIYTLIKTDMERVARRCGVADELGLE